MRFEANRIAKTIFHFSLAYIGVAGTYFTLKAIGIVP